MFQRVSSSVESCVLQGMVGDGAKDLQVWVDLSFELADRVHEFRNAVERVLAERDRDEDVVAGGKGVGAAGIDQGRAIDQDDVEAVEDLFQVEAAGAERRVGCSSADGALGERSRKTGPRGHTRPFGCWENSVKPESLIFKADMEQSPGPNGPAKSLAPGSKRPPGRRRSILQRRPPAVTCAIVNLPGGRFKLTPGMSFHQVLLRSQPGRSVVMLVHADVDHPLGRCRQIVDGPDVQF